MAKPTSKLTAFQQLEALMAEYESKSAQIKEDALTELQEQLKEAKAEVSRIEGEIAKITGKPAREAGAGTRAKRLPALEENSEEWKKLASQILLVMKHHTDGANGKEIAKGLGLTATNEIKRVQPVIQKTLKRQGEGIATKYFLK